MTLLTTLRSIITATVLSVVVVNPAIKHTFYPLAVQQDREEAYTSCTNDITLMGYECDSI